MLVLCFSLIKSHSIPLPFNAPQENAIVGFKKLNKNQEEYSIEGFINIDKFQNFTSSLTADKTTWISSGKCKQK